MMSRFPEGRDSEGDWWREHNESVRLVRDRTDREDHRAGVRARALRLINASLTGILFCFFRSPFF